MILHEINLAEMPSTAGIQIYDINGILQGCSSSNAYSLALL